MPSICWYILLAIIGLLVAALTILKKRNSASLSLFFIFLLLATSITWIGEFIVLGLFDAYAYKPGIFTDPWAENILGHLILNSTVYPGTAILVAAFSLGYGWMSFIALFYLLIEYMFIKLQIYEHHWWKYYMTGIAMFIYEIMTNYLFNKLLNIKRDLLRLCTLYLVCFVVLHYPIPILLLLEKQYFNVNWVPDRYLSSTMFIFVLQLIEAFFVVFFVGVLDKWYWKAAPLIMVLAGHYILYIFNILVLQNGWNLYHSIVVSFASLFVFIIIEKYTLIPVKR